MKIAPPKKLYKYQPFNLTTLGNLYQQTLYFSSPLKFNDPYDTALTASFIPLDKSTTETWAEHVKTLVSYEEMLKPQIEKLGFDAWAEMMLRKVNAWTSENREDFLKSWGVCCFSEINDNVLMWSHYADQCKGFCLEFDVTELKFINWNRISYREDIPFFDPLELYVKDKGLELLDLLFVKSKHWEYEREWRGVAKQPDTTQNYLSKALRAMYFGPRMPPLHMEIIYTYFVNARKTMPALFTSHPSEHRFEIRFQSYEFSPTLASSPSD